MTRLRVSNSRRRRRCPEHAKSRAPSGPVWQSRDFEKARSYLANDLVCDSPFGREATAEAMVGRFGRFSQVVSGPARELAGFGNDEERPPQIVLVERHT